MGLPKPPMKEVVGEAGEPSAPSRAVSGFISIGLWGPPNDAASIRFESIIDMLVGAKGWILTASWTRLGVGLG